MSVLDLFQHKNFIFAVTSQGYLLVWDISNSFQNSQSKKTQSLVKAAITIKINQNNKPLFQIFNHKRTLYMISSSHINIIKIDDAILAINSRCKLSDDKIDRISLQQIHYDHDFISCAALSSTKQILYIGTVRGQIHLLDLVQNKKIRSIVIEKAQITQNPQFSKIQSSENVTDMVLYRQQCIAIISTKSGRLLIYSLQSCNQIGQLNCKNGGIQCIKRVFVSQSESKIYTVHQNEIIEWNMTLGTSLGSFQYSYASSVCKLRNLNEILIGGVSQNIVIYKQQEKKNVELTVSMRSVNTIKEVRQNLVLFGGADNLVDVYKNGTRLVTLYAI